jgi:ATP-dependent RNA helicase RhlE
VRCFFKATSQASSKQLSFHVGWSTSPASGQLAGPNPLCSCESIILTQFTDLGLSEPILKALAQEGYDTPTPIQAKAIPPLLQGKDLLGIAQTGTGKTAAFALPILEHLAKSTERAAKGTAKVLILTPTRELAAQIGESFKTYGRNIKFSRAVVFGGTSIGKQIELCRGGLDVLVATPGRLVDLIERRAITLSKVEIFVLDEVDQMLDLGFIHAIRRIVSLIPKKRQNLFFSATMPKEIAGLAAGLLTDPVRVEVTPAATTTERVNQSVIHVDQPGKLALLNELLKDNNMTRTLVFTRTKHGADKVVRGLAQANYTASAIHGNKSQANREKALAGFKAGKIMVLVATDIAARGIDIDGVSHVINFDLPHVPESYVHRIGRTARAGAEGSAIALCAGDERSLLRDIERTIRMSIPVTIHPMGKSEVPQGGKEQRRPNGRATAPKQREDRPQSDRPQSDRPQSDRPKFERPTRERSDRPAFADRKPHFEKPHFEKPAHVEAAQQEQRQETAKEAAQRANWTPLQGEPTIMYQKPKPREPQAERPHQPWFKKNGFDNKFENKRGAGRGDFKPRGDRPTGDRPTGDRPHGDRPFNDRPKFDRAPAEGGGEARSFDRPRKPFGDKPFGAKPFGGKPRYDRGDKPAFNRDDKPRHEGSGERRDFAPRGDAKPFNRDNGPRQDRPSSDRPFNSDRPHQERGERPAHFGDKPRGNFGDKPRGNFGDKPRGNFAGGKPRGKFPGAGKPGGFSKPTGGTFKRKERSEG